MSFKRKIALNVSIIRTTNNLTQEEFAKRINISPSLVSKIENAVHIPSAEIIRSICNSFNVDSNWLIGLNNNSNYNDLIDLFSKLTIDQRNAILGLIKTMVK